MENSRYITYKIYLRDKQEINEWLLNLVTIELNDGKSLTNMADDLTISPLTLNKFLMGRILSFTSMCKVWRYFYNRDHNNKQGEISKS